MSPTLRASLVALVAALAIPAVAGAAPVERRLYSDTVESSSFLWNDWNKFVENYHPNYVADDDPTTAWVEGGEGSGAGEWLRLEVTPLAATTHLRLQIRNGYQKSKALFAANARAQKVVVRLLPSKVEATATLADKDGWQELTIDQPSGPLRAVELDVRSVYEGTKYKDLCISDIQVFATSETADNPAFEKNKRKALMAWRAARLAAAKVFKAGKVALPLAPGYQVAVTEQELECTSGCSIAGMVDAARADKGFAEWKDALAAAAAVTADLDKLTPAQLTPVSKTELPVPDGFERPTLDELAGSEGPWYEQRVLRLPLVKNAGVMTADQLRVLDIKRAQTPSEFVGAEQKKCKQDVAWVKRVPSAEKTGPARVQALVIGRCGKVEGREGFYPSQALQVLIYGQDGRLALVISEGAIDAYRWASDRGVVTGGRALLAQGYVLDATEQRP